MFVHVLYVWIEGTKSLCRLKEVEVEMEVTLLYCSRNPGFLPHVKLQIESSAIDE